MIDRISTLLRWARRLAKRSDAVLARAEEYVDEVRGETVVLHVGAISGPCMREGCGVPNGYPFCFDCASEMLSRRAN